MSSVVCCGTVFIVDWQVVVNAFVRIWIFFFFSIWRRFFTVQIDMRIAIVFLVVTVAVDAFGQIAPEFAWKVYHRPSDDLRANA